MVVVEPNSSTPCGKINPHDPPLLAARRVFHCITGFVSVVAMGDVVEAGMHVEEDSDIIWESNIILLMLWVL